MERPPYRVWKGHGGVHFSIGNQMFTLRNSFEDSDPECEPDRDFLVRMLTLALQNLAGERP